jgi:hypothetical protein
VAIAVIAIVIAVVSAAVAIYSAVTSKRALDWQRAQDRARVTPSVRVELEHGTEPDRGPIITAADLQDARPFPRRYRVTINVVNAGQTTERVKCIRVEAADRSDGQDLEIAGGDAEIQPGARFAREVPLAAIPNWQLGFIAIATLARGETFESGIEHGDSAILRQVEEHNRNAKPAW